MELILKYFPELTPLQQEQLEALGDLYRSWNERINVISRKDINHLYLHHILHSLAIGQVCRFGEGAQILDVGTGGGFPGIPLAILSPESHFTLVDSIGKKIRVVEQVASSVGLKNITPLHARAEQVKGSFDFVVSRAVTEMGPFINWIWSKLRTGSTAGTLPNGILYLKGGNLEQELSATAHPYRSYEIGEFFENPFFETKKVIYIPR